MSHEATPITSVISAINVPASNLIAGLGFSHEGGMIDVGEIGVASSGSFPTG